MSARRAGPRPSLQCAHGGGEVNTGMRHSGLNQDSGLTHSSGLTQEPPVAALSTVAASVSRRRTTKQGGAPCRGRPGAAQRQVVLPLHGMARTSGGAGLAAAGRHKNPNVERDLRNERFQIAGAAGGGTAGPERALARGFASLKGERMLAVLNAPNLRPSAPSTTVDKKTGCAKPLPTAV
jgi:hypothetical protein